MRLLVSIGVVGMSLAAGAAGAVPLASASLVFHSVSLGLAPVTIVGVGATGDAATPSLVSLGAGNAFAGPATGALSTSLLGLYDSIRFQNVTNAAGTFTGSPLSGRALFAATAVLSGPYLTVLPIGFGSPLLRRETIFLPTAGFPIPITIRGEAWQQATNMLTANGAGNMSLVTPILFSSPVLPTLSYTLTAELHLTFVPEPTSGLLLGWGILCLCVEGRRRARAR